LLSTPSTGILYPSLLGDSLVAKPKKPIRIPPVSADEALALQDIVEKATRNFNGQFDELENALGMLMIGRLVGWKLLVFIHNKRTIRKYEEILGINVREAFPEEGPLAVKSPAYAVVKDLGNFWKAVSGSVKVEDRRALQSL
jgi:hypothetical protein